MYCPKCGSQTPDGQRFCSNCGAEIPTNANLGGNLGGGQSNQQFQGGAPFGGGMQLGGGYQQTSYSMSWYKFLIYFALFASAVGNVINGILFITGAHFDMYEDGLSEMMYQLSTGIKVLDVIFCLAYIGLAVYAILTRNALASYKSNGPTMLYGLFLFNGASTLLYTLIFSAVFKAALVREAGFAGYAVNQVFNEIIKEFGFWPQSILAVIGAIVMIVLNRIYFNKRASLFRN